MLTYKAMFKFVEGGVHAEVLDFPGAISCGGDLAEARRMVASALEDMAETFMMMGRSLPVPDPSFSDPKADLQEPVYLFVE